MIFVYLCLVKQLLKFDLTDLLLFTEVCGGQGPIDFCDTQKKGKHMVGPVFGYPNNFQTNQRVLFIVVVIHGVML